MVLLLQTAWMPEKKSSNQLLICFSLNRLCIIEKQSLNLHLTTEFIEVGSLRLASTSLQSLQSRVMVILFHGHVTAGGSEIHDLMPISAPSKLLCHDFGSERLQIGSRDF